MSEVIEAFKPKCPVEGWVQCINCIYHKKMESYDMCDFDYHSVNAQFPQMCVHYVQKNPAPTVDGFIKANAEILAIAEMKRVVEEAEANRKYEGFTKEQLSEVKKMIDDMQNNLDYWMYCQEVQREQSEQFNSMMNALVVNGQIKHKKKFRFLGGDNNG